MNKEFGAQSLVSDKVRREIGDTGADFTPLGDGAIRGYDHRRSCGALLETVKANVLV